MLMIRPSGPLRVVSVSNHISPLALGTDKGIGLIVVSDARGPVLSHKFVGNGNLDKE